MEFKYDEESIDSNTTFKKGESLNGENGRGHSI